MRGAWIEIAAVMVFFLLFRGSLPVRGAWIEIFLLFASRQLKPSLPVRGAWIEISCGFPRPAALPGRSPCGERGLKFFARATSHARPRRRSPCGERGLKLRMPLSVRLLLPSLPVRGAWIEIELFAASGEEKKSRSPCGERGLKFHHVKRVIEIQPGRSPCGERGLKFLAPDADGVVHAVAPRAGSVD